MPLFWGTPTLYQNTKLYKFVTNISPNKLRIKHCTELNLNEIVYISIIYHISTFWLYLLNVYDGYFVHRSQPRCHSFLLVSFKSCVCLFSQILHLRKNKQVSTTTTEPSKSEFKTYKETGGNSDMRVETYQDAQWNLGLVYQNTEWIQSSSTRWTEENSTGVVTEHFRAKKRGLLLCLLGEVRRFPETFPNIVK